MGGGFIVLRLVHVTLAMFWGGGVLFMNLVVGPSLAASGPEGVKVMAELNRRRYIEIMLTVGVVVILSGLDLMRRDSDGFSAGWFHSAIGIGFSTGMIATIIGWLIGFVAIRPTAKEMRAIGAQLAQAAPEACAALHVRLGHARGRLIAFGLVGSLFMLIAMMAMATARYL